MDLKKFSLFSLLLTIVSHAFAQSDVSIGSSYKLNLQRQTDNADAFILHNAKVDAGSSLVYRWESNHSVFGSRGIHFQYYTGIHFFADAVTTDAGHVFTPTTRFFIGNNGNVGVGTTNPQARLDVAGDVRFASRVIFTTANAYTNGSYGVIGLMTGVPGKNIVFYNYDGPVNELMTLNGTTGSVAINNGGLTVGGSVGIGTATPGTFKLAVEGKIGAREVNVTASAWADYVLKDGYRLRPLSEVQEFISVNHHLPDVPSEQEVLANGQNLGEMNAILLKKIEELTLYIIELKQENLELQELKNEVDEIKKVMKKIK